MACGGELVDGFVVPEAPVDNFAEFAAASAGAASVDTNYNVALRCEIVLPSEAPTAEYGL